MSQELATLLLLLGSLVLLFLGVPIAWALGGTAVCFALGFWGLDRIYMLATASLGSLSNANLIAVPLFVLMGWILDRSGIADDLFESMAAWFGSIKGGLAMATIVIAAVYGAVSGDLMACIFTMTTIALPPLAKRGYNLRLSIGCIMAGAVLAEFVPPSTIIIAFCAVTGLSVGRAYLGAFIPSLIMAALYCLYAGILCHFKPEYGPAAPPVSLREKFIKLKGSIMTILILLAMLLGIYSGAVTPMEASALGCAGAFICAAIKRRLNWKITWEALLITGRITTMIGWLFITIACFTVVGDNLGMIDVAHRIALSIPGGGMGAIMMMMATVFVLGCFMDDLAITLICGPIFMSVAKKMGFNEVWFGIIFLCNMQTAFLTPPYGFALIVQKAVLPMLKERVSVPTRDIVLAGVPFIGMLLLTLVLVIVFPQLITWLPSLVIK